jgi:hypothetical protein
LLPIDSAGAHGNLDQFLAGDPGCNATNFPESAPLDASRRQEFVPSGPKLSSVAVCLQSSAAGGTIVSIAVRAGTASSPGALIGALNVTLPAGATTYMHADFPVPLTVSASTAYVIEVAQAPGQIAWRGAPPGVDWYAPGQSSTSITDLAFKTFLEPAAQPTATKTLPPPPTSIAATATTAPTKTATKVATRTTTPAATPTLAAVATAIAPQAPPSTPTPAIPSVTQPQIGAPPPATAGAGAPSSSAQTQGRATSASATPQVSPTRVGVVLAATTPVADEDEDGSAVVVEESNGGGVRWGVVMMTVIGVAALGGAGAYGVRRWRMRG